MPAKSPVKTVRSPRRYQAAENGLYTVPLATVERIAASA